jgi:L-fucose mutarotase
MLNGISPYLSPDLLSTLYRMGHGDEIVLADAHFPGESKNSNVIRADGIKITDLLSGILPLMPPDTYADNSLLMMDTVPGDEPNIELKKNYLEIINQFWPENNHIEFLERFAFYKRAESAFAVVMTGETAKYGNIILKKGIVQSF